MNEYLLVDGYNVINAWPELIGLKEVNFEHARLRLIDILSNYAGFRGIKVILVFDAHQVKGGTGSREDLGSLEVIYTSENNTADMVIEKLVTNLASIVPEVKVFVATSDRIEQNVILGRGAYRISSRELLIDVEKAQRQGWGYFQPKNLQPYSLDAHLNDHIKKELEKMRRARTKLNRS